MTNNYFTTSIFITFICITFICILLLLRLLCRSQCCSYNETDTIDIINDIVNPHFYNVNTRFDKDKKTIEI